METEKYMNECFNFCCEQPKEWNYKTGEPGATPPAIEI